MQSISVEVFVVVAVGGKIESPSQFIGLMVRASLPKEFFRLPWQFGTKKISVYIFFAEFSFTEFSFALYITEYSIYIPGYIFIHSRTFKSSIYRFLSAKGRRRLKKKREMSSASPSPAVGGGNRQPDQIHFRFCREW